jgi:outer membrane protein assembly factor BamD (BamD/ComL family)
LGKFPNSTYREQSVQHLFDIANYWLDDTRQAMKEDKERREGKRWIVMPRFVSFEKDKPLLDREGRAIEALEKVRLHDINGPLADEALFMCGIVKMYDENYREAVHYFSQIHQRHPDSKRAPQSIKLAVFCSHMSTGGADYDGRKAAEARKLIQVALASYPELAHDPQTRDWLMNQSKSIDLQQAEKDYQMAEFYRRTGHPGSAYFYYELVQKRYKDTKYAKMARERWEEMRGEIERKNETMPAPQPLGLQMPKPQNAPAPK